MGVFFNRTYEFYVGEPVPVKKVYAPGDVVVIDNYVDTTSNKKSNPNTFLLTQHQISFNIKKDKKTEGNKSTITVTNPPKKLVDYLELFSTKKIAFILKAGYAGDNVTIFQGTIEKFEFKFNGPDSKLEIKGTDAGNNLKEATSVRSYPVGTPYSKIAEDLTKDLGLPVGIVTGFIGNTKSPTYISGKTSLNLNWLTKAHNLDFSVQDGAVYIFPEGKRIKKDVFELKADTGLIGEVEAYNNNSDKQANDTTGVKPAIKLTSLLNGRIIPNSTIYVESSDKRYKGYYKVTEVTHRGEYEGNSGWFTEIVATDVGNNTV